VAAGVNVTYKILYNAAVAMTGGQAVTGLMDVPSLTRALAAEGVATIVVCAEDPRRYGRRAAWAKGVEVRGRDRLPEVQERLEKVPGVTVIVYDQRCAAESRRLRKQGLLPEPPARVVINEAVCEGCGDCGVKSNCLSVMPVDTEFGEKRRIHDPSCNRDYTCLEGDCPSFVTLTPRRRRRPRRRPGVVDAPRHVAPTLPDGVLPAPPATPPVDPFGVYFTGIGGTGVVTANRIVATAAEISGRAVAGLDQTGLSQKAGAVVSHLHMALDPSLLSAATVGPVGADLYLSGDLLQAASPRHLDRVRPGRTVAVVDNGITPTAAMLQTDVAPPDRGALERAVEERVGRQRVVFFDAKRYAEALFGNHLLANVMVLGAACQLGGLPLPLNAVDQAIGRLGRQAADNADAFLWGRWVVHRPAAVEAAVQRAEDGTGGAPRSPTDPTPESRTRAMSLVSRAEVPADLYDLVVRRTAQVVDYQDAARADRFLRLVRRALAVDDPAAAWAFSRAVLEGWFKVLTYKDEYEVARLHLNVDYDEVARQLGMEGDYSVAYHLHPPILRRMGLKKKLPLGSTYRASFVALRRMKRLRGSRLDPFGWDRDRRTERSVVDEYERLMEEMTRPSCDVPYAARVELARSVLAIKGYGAIKEAAVARWRDQVTAAHPAPDRSSA
jgi:indolepyruvate ferredoxin oxidoreductase